MEDSDDDFGAFSSPNTNNDNGVGTIEPTTCTVTSKLPEPSFIDPDADGDGDEDESFGDFSAGTSATAVTTSPHAAVAPSTSVIDDGFIDPDPNNEDEDFGAFDTAPAVPFTAAVADAIALAEGEDQDDDFSFGTATAADPPVSAEPVSEEAGLPVPAPPTAAESTIVEDEDEFGSFAPATSTIATESTTDPVNEPAFIDPDAETGTIDFGLSNASPDVVVESAAEVSEQQVSPAAAIAASSETDGPAATIESTDELVRGEPEATLREFEPKHLFSGKRTLSKVNSKDDHAPVDPVVPTDTSSSGASQPEPEPFPSLTHDEQPTLKFIDTSSKFGHGRFQTADEKRKLRESTESSVAAPVDPISSSLHTVGDKTHSSPSPNVDVPTGPSEPSEDVTEEKTVEGSNTPSPTVVPIAAAVVAEPPKDAETAAEQSEEEDDDIAFSSFTPAPNTGVAATEPSFIDPDAEPAATIDFSLSNASPDVVLESSNDPSPPVTTPPVITTESASSFVDPDEDFGAFETPVTATTATAVDDPSPKKSEPSFVDPDADDDEDESFGDFSASTRAAAAVTTSSPHDTAVPSIAAIESAAFIDPDGGDGNEDFGAFDTAAAVPLAPSESETFVPVATSAVVDEEIEEFGSFDGAPTAAPVVAGPSAMPEPSETAAADVGDEDDFGDFSSQPALSTAASVPGSIAVAAPSQVSAPTTSQAEDDEEDFGDFSSQPAFASAPAPTSVTAPPTQPVQPDAGGEEDEWGEFNDSSTTVPAAAPVTAPVPVATSAADLHGSGAVAQSIALWRSSHAEVDVALTNVLANVFPAPPPTPQNHSGILSVGHTLQERGPYLADKGDACASCGAAIARAGSRLCVHCGRSLPLATPPIQAFKGSVIYTHLFDALGVAPPTLPPPSPTNISGEGAGVVGGGEDGEVLTTAVPVPTPSPKLEESKTSASAAASSQSGVWPNVESVQDSSSFALDLDFFSSAVVASSAGVPTPSNSPPPLSTSTNRSMTTTANSTNTSQIPHQAKDRHNLSSTMMTQTNASVSLFDTNNESGTINQPTQRTRSDDLDSLDWLNDATIAGAPTSTGSPQPIAATEDEDEEFADFSSAPPVSGASTLASPIASHGGRSDGSIGIGAFTVTSAKPSRGEVALKKLQELVAGLPDLAFIANIPT